MKFRMNEVGKVYGGVRKVFKRRSLGMNKKRRLLVYQGIELPTVLYGDETYNIGVAERRNFNVTETRCVGSVSGVSGMNRVRNEEERTRTGVVRESADRAEEVPLRWFGALGKSREWKKNI